MPRHRTRTHTRLLSWAPTLSLPRAASLNQTMGIPRDCRAATNTDTPTMLAAKSGNFTEASATSPVAKEASPITALTNSDSTRSPIVLAMPPRCAAFRDRQRRCAPHSRPGLEASGLVAGRARQGPGLGLEDGGVVPHLRHAASGAGEVRTFMSVAPKISFVSLGCPKALVDSERIVTRLRAEGYELAREHKGADLVVVNTCGFLDSARDESLAAIGSAIAENGRVIVTGCLGAEPGGIRAAPPKVLAVTGPQQYESVMTAVHEAVPPMHDPFLDL